MSTSTANLDGLSGAKLRKAVEQIDLSTAKVAELKEIARACGLPIGKGTKAVLTKAISGWLKAQDGDSKKAAKKAKADKPKTVRPADIIRSFWLKHGWGAPEKADECKAAILDVNPKSKGAEKDIHGYMRNGLYTARKADNDFWKAFAEKHGTQESESETDR